MFSFKKDTNWYLLFDQKNLFSVFVLYLFWENWCQKVFYHPKHKTIYFALFSHPSVPPTPILFLFFPFNYHLSSNKKLPPTHNNPTPSSMTSLSQPLNPAIERKPAYPKLNTITWTNPKKKKPSLLGNQANQATYCCCKNDSLPIRCCCRERERERSKMMVAWLQDCNDK